MGEVAGAINWSTMWDGAMVLLTVVLAAVALWQAAIARQAARQGLRAYVAVNDVELSFSEDDSYAFVKLQVKNHGQTPAQGVTITISIEAETHPHPLTLGTVCLAPQEETSVTQPLASERSLKIIRAQLAADEPNIHVEGQVRYTDAFGRARQTLFSYSWDALGKALFVDGGRNCIL